MPRVKVADAAAAAKANPREFAILTQLADSSDGYAVDGKVRRPHHAIHAAVAFLLTCHRMPGADSKRDKAWKPGSCSSGIYR
jgi:hypothetical protein